MVVFPVYLENKAETKKVCWVNKVTLVESYHIPKFGPLKLGHPVYIYNITPKVYETGVEELGHPN